MQTLFPRTFSAAVAVLFIIGAVSTASASESQARVSQVIQDVRLLEPHGAPRPAAVNDKVTRDMGVRTGVQSRAELVFPDLTLTRLGANTIFSFKEGSRELDLTSGAVLLQVPPNQAAVKVNTAAITAAVTGGTALLSTGPPTKFMVLEGTGTFYPVGHPERTVIVHSGEMMMMEAGKRMTKPEKFDVKLVLKTSGLIKNFPPLQNLPLVMTVVDQQIAEQLAGATNQPLARNLVDVIGTTDQNSNSNPVILVRNSTPTPTPSPVPPTPTPSATPIKFGTPATITSPNPYLITSGTLITTDPSITTNGVTDYGKIYRGQSIDGPASAWAFGATSAFDVASGFDDLIGDTSGAAFKFTALQLTGNPTIDITNGETNLGLIAVNGITSGGPGGVLTFSGISGLLLATQNGSITLGPEISFSGLQDLTVYARGSSSDLTLGAGITTSSQVRLLAERDLSMTSSITTNDLYAFVGGNVTLSSSAAVHAPTLTLFAGGNLICSDLISDEMASTFTGDVSISAGQALNIANDLNITRENGGISSGLNLILSTGTDFSVGGDTTFLVNNNVSQVVNGARILDTIGGNLETNNLTLELLNNGGQIASGGNVSLEVSGSLITQDAIFEIQNNGGTMGQSAPVQIAATNITANSLLAEIDNLNGGTIGGDAHIFMTVTGSANVANDATLAIFGSNGAANSSILVNGGNYNVGGTFLSYIDGNGSITFNNATAHADVLKAGVFGANGVLNVGGGTLSADTTLKLYAPGSNGQLNFVSNVTLGGNSAKILAANSITIFDNVVVTIGGQLPAEVYTNNANYSEQWGGNGTTTGTFAGAGANRPLPLSQAPPFDAPLPGNPTNGKKVKAVINIRNSGELLSLLDDTVPGRNGRLKFSQSHHRHGQNKDRPMIGRITKAEHNMINSQRSPDRLLSNARLGSAGRRAF
ncbi:MAG TPA: FecR family protein [Candidatus Udaeobacter sp.]|jgi:hypothetical protein|nr:FecR family protein [Candidatus Udaeobacter sp.]